MPSIYCRLTCTKTKKNEHQTVTRNNNNNISQGKKISNNKEIFYILLSRKISFYLNVDGNVVDGDAVVTVDELFGSGGMFTVVSF